MNKILITGNKGFIGAELQKIIEANGMDLKDGQDVCKGIKGGYDIIYHLASFMRNEKNLYENNIKSTEKVVEYCKKKGAYLVFTSSAAVYGNAELYPIQEDEPLNPINEYGKSKVECERIIEDNLKNYLIFRLSNVIFTPDGVWDKFTKGDKTIYNDGTQIRDFISSLEVIKVLKEAVKKEHQGIYNLSSGVGISIKGLFEATGQRQPKYIKLNKPEIHTSILDNSKLKRDFRR